MEKDIVIAILSALSFFNLIFAVVNFNTNARLRKINRVSPCAGQKSRRRNRQQRAS